MKKTIENPRVFISYAWGTEEYREKVISFANTLMNDGIDVVIDQWSLEEGDDKNSFMERTVNDDSITNVLILIDPIYAKKANDKQGGVGTETQIISQEVYAKVKQNKFLPIVFEKDEEGNIQKPIYLDSRIHFDLSDSQTYSKEYRRLVRRLFGIKSVPKPTLGKEPEWLEKEDSIGVVDIMEFESIKKAGNVNKDVEFEKILEDIKEELLKEYLDIENEKLTQIEVYNIIIPIRNKYLELLQNVKYIDDPEKAIADCLEQILQRLNLEMNNKNQDLFKIAIQEWFIYTIASFMKNKMYSNVNYLFERSYFTERYDDKKTNHRFSIFRHNNCHRLDKEICDRDDKDYYCGTAQFWIDNIYIKHYSKEDFTFADIMCFNASVYLKDYSEAFYWFPLTYVYAGDNYALRYFSSKLKSIENLNSVLPLFSMESIDEFKKRFDEIDAIRMKRGFEDIRYPRSFNSAPLINQFVDFEDLGIFN